MNISGLISGIVSGLLGIYFLGVLLMTRNGIKEIIILILFGIIFIGIGISILFNLSDEDKIEKVRYKKSIAFKK
jgi:uncharacterized membrane protein HdeD (DUF308 family)